MQSGVGVRRFDGTFRACAVTMTDFASQCQRHVTRLKLLPQSVLFAAAAIWGHNDDGLQIRRQRIFIASAVALGYILRISHAATDLFNRHWFYAATRIFNSHYRLHKMTMLISPISGA